MKEIWRPIKGYETYYEISNFGNVRSVDRIVTYSNGRKRLWKGQMMKPYKDRYGYLALNLCKNSKYSAFTVHRLVAQAFLPNPDNLPVINHKDENKTSNFVFLNKDGSVDFDKSNLEWCSISYNNCYGTRLKHIVEKLSKPVIQIDNVTDEVIAEYPSTMEAARQLNISQGHISACCNGKLKTYKRFKWRYKE